MSAPKKNHGKLQSTWDTMCRNKSRYSDEYAARVSAQHLLSTGKIDIPFMWTYKCPSCRGWHITKSANNLPAISATDLFVTGVDTSKTRVYREKL